MNLKAYHNVTRQEIEAVLFPLGFVEVEVPGTVELVYAKRVDQGDLALSLRVYSGIDPSGDSRGCGEDAIRVTLFWRDCTRSDPRDPNRPLAVKVSGDKRVNRIQTWEKNLRSRLEKWDDFPKSKCPKCGRPMVVRSGKYGDFLGCAGYPQCDHKEKKAK